MKTKHIPTGSMETINEAANAVVYTHYRDGVPHATGYSGKRGNADFHYRFKSKAHMLKHIENYFDGRINRIEGKAKYKVLAKAAGLKLASEIKAGDIFYCSWGYDQTNIDFYQVIGIKSMTVTFKKLHQTQTEDLSMQGETSAIKDSFKGDSFKKIIRGGYISLSSYMSLRRWDGKPKRNSWYA